MLQQILFILTQFGMDLFGLIEPIQPLPVGLFPMPNEVKRDKSRWRVGEFQIENVSLCEEKILKIKKKLFFQFQEIKLLQGG